MVATWVDIARLTAAVKFDEAGARTGWKPTVETVARIKAQLTVYACVAAGGPEVFEGTSVRQTHVRMGIDASQSEQFLLCLEQALRTEKIPGELSAEFVHLMRRTAAQLTPE